MEAKKREHPVYTEQYKSQAVEMVIHSGKSHSFGGTYLELKAYERIRYTDKLEGLPGEMQVTIMLNQVFCGTELNITQEGVPAAIPAEACHLGWQESLTLMAKLVEAEIPDEM